MGRRTVDTETDALGVVTTRRFLWCGSRICQTRNGSDTVQSRILPEGELSVVSGQKAVYMPDQLGSVRDVLDATTGNLISSIDYSPYGKITQSNGSFAPLYQFAGLMYHPQSALLLSMTRALDQSQHWLNRDPIREGGGWNLYAYVSNRPIRFTDPWGLQEEIFVPPDMLGPEAPEATPIPQETPMPQQTPIPPRGLPPEGMEPPVEGQCKEGPPSRPSEVQKGGKSLWDPNGGEWRYFPGDKYHNPHWDYNPHNAPNSPWQNIPINNLPPLIT
jgi:RHS repeat-associated protein